MHGQQNIKKKKIAFMVLHFSRIGPVGKNTNACWYASCVIQAFQCF